MINRVANKFSFARMALLASAAVVVLVGPIALGVVQASASQAQGPFSFETIEVPGASLVVATGIDIQGRVVGYYVDGRGTHGFLHAGNSLAAIDYPGAAWTAAYGINAAGQIVGAYGPGESAGRRGFLLGGGNFTSLEFPGSSDTVARGLNNRAQIVGDYLGADGLRHGFLLSGGNYSIVEVPQSGSGSASGISDSGQITGLAGSGPGARGFVFADGQYSRVQFPESSYTESLGINNLGDIVGQLDNPQSPSRAFRRSGSSYTTVELPDSPVSGDARGINDLGQIVGSLTGRDGVTRGYRATPAGMMVVNATRSNPADIQGVTNITNVTNGNLPGTQIVPGPAGPQGPQGPAGPMGPPGPVARPEPTRAETLARALDNMSNRLANASSAIQKSAPYRQGGEMGKALEKAVAAIAVVREHVAAAQVFARNNPASANAPTPETPDINFEAPVAGGNEGPLVPPSVAIALNNLRGGFDALKRAPGGDLGELRGKISADMKIAVELVFAALKTQEESGGRGQRGQRGRGAAAVTQEPVGREEKGNRP